MSKGIVFSLLAMALAGCSALNFSSSPPKARVSSFQLSTNVVTGLQALTVVQAQIMRFADTYAATIAQACDDITAQTTNSALRLSVLRWKLGQSTSAYVNAAGENPVINALDMLVLASMARMVIQDYGVETYGDAILPLLAAQEKMETTIWTMANSVLKPVQQKELKDLIQEWRAKNPHQRYVGPIRFREFVTALGKAPTKASSSPTSIFSLLYLDPLAGLDPTAAAIEETRELGERAMYYSQRMPMLMSWQVEVLSYQIANQPESKAIISDVDRLAASAEIFAKTAQQLPQLVNDQREAAIRQLLDGLKSEEMKTRELLTEARQTLNAGRDMAGTVNTAIKSLDEFVRYVSPTNDNQTAASTNNQPFNVLDYGKSASQIGTAARELNELLTSLNQTTPKLAQIGQQTTADATRVVDYAFRRGLILVVVLLVGWVIAGVIRQVLANKAVKKTKFESAN
jgi:hypothetical protein